MYKAMVVVVVGCVFYLFACYVFLWTFLINVLCGAVVVFYFFLHILCGFAYNSYTLTSDSYNIYREILRILIFWAKWGNSRASRFVSVVVDCDWLFSYFCIFVFDSWSLTSLGILMYIYIAAYSHNFYCGGCEFAVNIYVGFF